MTTNSTCIICYTTWDTTSNRDIYFDEKLEANRNKFILNNFSRHLGVPLPIKTVDWNFEQDSLPFCSTCKETAENLIELHQQLDSIQQAICRLKKSVRQQISKSSLDSNDDPNDDKDGRVKIIRDLIVGPVLCLERVQTSQLGRRKRRRVTTTNFTRYDEAIPCSPAKVELDTMSNVQIEVDDDDDVPLATLYHINNDTDDDPTCSKSIQNFNDADDLPFNNNDDDGRHALTDENHCDSEPETITIPDSPKGKPTAERKYPARIRKKVEILQLNHDPPPRPVKPPSPPPPPPPPPESESEEEILTDEDDDDKNVVDDPRDKDFEPTALDLQGFELENKVRTQPSRQFVSKKSIKLQTGKFSYGGFPYSGYKAKGFTCDTCNPSKLYKGKTSIYSHIRRHHLNERPNLCELCGKGFIYELQLARHMETHEQKECMCHVCAGIFKSDHLLSKHIRKTHDQEDAFPCDLCDEKFNSESKRSHHIDKTHTFGPQIRYPCPICDGAFTNSSYLPKHMQIFHPNQVNGNDTMDEESGELNRSSESQLKTAAAEGNETRKSYPCSECHLSYATLMHANRHMRKMHKLDIPKVKKKWKSRNIPCSHCNKTYSGMDKLRTHQLKVHNLQPQYKTKGRISLQQKQRQQVNGEEEEAVENDSDDDDSNEDDESNPIEPLDLFY